MECLIQHLDKMKQVYKQPTHPPLANSINLAWAKLDEYYVKMNETPAYACALLLHLQYRYRYFENNWKEYLSKYRPKTRKVMREVYDRQYKRVSAEDIIDDVTKDDCVNTFLKKALPTSISSDEYKEYAEDRPTKTTPPNVFKWWAECESLALC
jgi:hypothetical protein